MFISVLAVPPANIPWWKIAAGTVYCQLRRHFATEPQRIYQHTLRRSTTDLDKYPPRDLQSAKQSESAFVVPRRGNVPYYGANTTRQPVPLSATTVTWDSPKPADNATVVRVALVGLPNAGKSSLMNALLNVPIAAVSPKVNTTREDIKGVICDGNCQMIFTDCPGILESHRRRRFCAPLVDTAWRVYREADVCLFVIDAVKRPRADLFRVIRLLAGSTPSDSSAHPLPLGDDGRVYDSTQGVADDVYELEDGDISDDGTADYSSDTDYGLAVSSEPRKPVALVLNKIDLVQHKKWVRARTREMKNHGTFSEIFYTSAKHGLGCEHIFGFLKSVAKPGPWVYPPDMVTTMSKVQVVEQSVRTYLYCWFNRELPYQVNQKVIGWTTAENGALIIEMELYVRNDKAAKIICGIEGRIVKQMQKNVSYRLSRMWSEPVFVYIHVKVKAAFL
ncbi:GTPase Era [Babesia sp. Xinjiang]|uniref:GTPase Era n=1 Tax=Babesia sp. Xinjiang TaxID=462227 RepID=UPI000A21FAF7|nr:GTPase Era [Babesia sp. Xinjiang]ORM39990.1 GTPase Era [Babesia sp. Xinjiang]